MFEPEEDKELCAMTDMCEKSAMTFDASLALQFQSYRATRNPKSEWF